MNARRLGGALSWAQWLMAAGGIALLTLGATSCGDSSKSTSYGEVEVAITRVPDDVACIAITAAGPGRSTIREFDVKPGERSILPLSGLPVGEVRFYGNAYDSACANRSPSANANWVGGPASADLVAGVMARVTLVLRQNGLGVVAVDFELDPATGAPCVDPDRPECLNPMDAVGDADDLPPPGAKMVSPAEFGAALNTGAIRLTSGPIVRDAEQTFEQQIDAARAALSRIAESDPTLAERIARILGSAPQEDDRLRRLDDGDGRSDDDDFVLTLADETPDGALQKVVTMGHHFALAEADAALSQFETKSNQLAVYSDAYERLPAEYLKGRGNQLPTPKEASQLPAVQLLQLNSSLVEDLAAIIRLLPPIVINLPPSCENEEGAPAVLTDQVGASCSHDPSSIWANHTFPLKWKATCVKNQASRGTCVSFGITGAIEAEIADTYNRWLNLSEQRLYYWAKVPSAYGDGLNTSGTMDNMVSTAFTYPFEVNWDYNPSQSRVDTGSAYTNSCTGYSGEHCSNTAHQGDRICVQILFWTFCGWDGRAPATSGFRMTSTQQLFDFGKSFGSLLGRLHLALGRPLVISFSVTPSFDSAASNGVVTYVGSGEGNRGGHATAVMGFIDNSNLPDGIPDGAGGGYFIVKNSWGACWKDAGYVYLPYQWVEAYAYSLKVVGGIN